MQICRTTQFATGSVIQLTRPFLSDEVAADDPIDVLQIVIRNAFTSFEALKESMGWSTIPPYLVERLVC